MQQATQNFSDEAIVGTRRSARVAPPVAETLNAAAARFVREADGDNHRALGMLMDWISDNATRQMVLESVIKEAASALQSRVRTQLRTGILSGSTKANIIMAGQAFARLYLDYPVEGYGRLRDLTGAEVLLAAQAHAARADDQRRKAAWLQSIGNRVPGGVVVSAVLTENDAKAAWEAVQ